MKNLKWVLVYPKFYLPMVLLDQEFMNIWGEMDAVIKAFGQQILVDHILRVLEGTKSMSDLSKLMPQKDDCKQANE